MNPASARPASVLVGILMGGASSRMGQTKGMLIVPSEVVLEGRALQERGEALRAPSTRGGALVGRTEDHGSGEESGETIVARTVRVVRQAVSDVEICLVGNREEFDNLGIQRVRDARENSGPLGGIVSLLRAASIRNCPNAIALGSDFPFLTETIIRRLASEAPDALVLAPFLDERYQPLVARYSVQALPAFESALLGTRFGLQGILRKLEAARLELEASDIEALVDWDTPEDRTKSRRN